MFSLEKLLKDLVEDPRTTQSMLRKIRPAVEKLFRQELKNRKLLRERGAREGKMEDVSNDRTHYYYRGLLD